MMESTEILALYDDVAAITHQMVHAARDRDWQRLTVLESDCTSTVQRIRDNENPAPLTPEMKERKIQLIKKILADDREIRDITEPWMAELATLMKSSKTSMKLSQAYGSAATA